jgi:hypothetical protein
MTRIVLVLLRLAPHALPGPFSDLRVDSPAGSLAAAAAPAALLGSVAG